MTASGTAPPGPGLRRPRLAGLALPARAEDPRYRARLPRRHHRPASRSPCWFGQPPGLEPGHRHRRPRPRRPGRRRPRPGRERVRRVPPAPRRRAAGRRGRLRPHPQRRPARLLHRLAPSATATWPATTWTSGPRRLRPGPALPGRRPPLPAHRHGPAADGSLDWAAVTRLLQPEPRRERPRQPRPGPGRDLSGLARWVAGQPEGNRNAGLFWAANRALETDPAADLSALADAARQAGLGEREITRTLDSARNGGRTRTHAPDYQAEAGDQA